MIKCFFTKRPLFNAASIGIYTNRLKKIDFFNFSVNRFNRFFRFDSQPYFLELRKQSDWLKKIIWELTIVLRVFIYCLKASLSAPLITIYILQLGQRRRCCFCAPCSISRCILRLAEQTKGFLVLSSAKFPEMKTRQIYSYVNKILVQ